TRQIVAHPWVKNAEFAINTDAGGGILDEASGKPLIYLVQGAEKTYATFDVIATNPGGHSSRPRADNAIYQLAHALEKLEAYRFPVMATDLTRSYLGAVGKAQEGPVGEAVREFSAHHNDGAAAAGGKAQEGPGGEALRKFSADPNDAAAAEVLAKSPEFVGTTRTTCVATMLEAGHAENALPQTAKAAVNCRIFPGVAVDTVRDALVAAVADPEVKIAARGKPEASPVSEMRPDVMAAITRAVHAHYPGVTVT